jgi:hypothetical protein
MVAWSGIEPVSHAFSIAVHVKCSLAKAIEIKLIMGKFFVFHRGLSKLTFAV